MSYECKILADSVSTGGVRLTTFEVTFPRFILAEVNTHRMLSRNSASLRAIPPERLIERVREHPFIPETFNKRVKGMGVGEAFSEREQQAARAVWENAAEYATCYAEQLAGLDVDKSRVNRLLEPFMWHTAILSGTEWSNFFALRCHPDAQPEFQIIANMMRDEMEENQTGVVLEGQWHLPLVGADFPYDTPDPDWEYWAMVGAGRCARVSFDTHDNYEEPEKSYERAQRLKTSGHLSPFEHVARPLTDDECLYTGTDYHPVPSEEYRGNFRGWVQMRKQISHESNFAEVVQV